MGKFSVGDVAIAVCPAGNPDHLGMHGIEVTVIKPLRRRRMITNEGVHQCYVVNWPGRPAGYELQALPEWLRRKEDKIEWSNCIFQPECALTSSAVTSEKP